MYIRYYNLFPLSSTFPTIFLGFITKVNGGTSFVTTVPDPIRAYSPIVTPHIIVAFAPILADFLTSVFE